VDQVVYTYNARGEPEEGTIYLQVKARERLKRVLRGRAIAFRLDRSDLQTWLAEPMPVVLCVHDTTLETTYWLYLQHYFENLPGFNLIRAGKTVTVYLPTKQKLDVAAVSEPAGHLEHVRKQIRGKISHV
jgi:hypothetical protein